MRSTEDAATARLVRRTLRQWPLVVLCAVAAAVAAYFASNSRTPMYESTTVVQLNSVDLGSVFLQTNLQQQGDDTDTKTATSAKIVTLPRVREYTSKVLGGRVSTSTLASAVSVAPETGTTLVDISATDPDPRLAAQIADATREAFIAVRTQASVSQLNAATKDVQEQLSALSDGQRASVNAESLRTRLQQIGTLRAVSNGGVDTLQTARIPSAPVSPNPKRDAILGLLAGGLLGVGIALLRSRLDTRIRDADELGEIWNLPVLGLIPQAKDLARGTQVRTSGATLEAFALARTSLRYLHVGGDVKTVLVTSATEGEGKSTVSWNLAVAAAMAEARVLVVEADLRRPVLSDRLNIRAQHGLSEVLAGLATFESSVVRVPTEDVGDKGVDVLFAGMVPPSPIALLEREGTGALLAAAARSYDLVIVDSPPATVVADAQVLLGDVDGVIVVSRLGTARRTSFERLRDLFAGTDTPVLGFIVNGGGTAQSYSYSAYTQPESGAKRSRAAKASVAKPG